MCFLSNLSIEADAIPIPFISLTLSPLCKAVHLFKLFQTQSKRCINSLTNVYSEHGRLKFSNPIGQLLWSGADRYVLFCGSMFVPALILSQPKFELNKSTLCFSLKFIK